MVVIAIIVILAGLLFPAVQSVLDRAKKVQAKNDLTQIVTAVNAFYTEYGRYPVNTTSGAASDVTFATNPTNDQLFDVLRNSATGGNSSLVATLNPRQIVFMSPPNVRDTSNPKFGISSNGQYYDPWGKPYNIAVDANYNNIVAAPAYTDLQGNYTTAADGSGDTGVRQGTISWSFGKDKQLGNNGDGKFSGSDDVISWQ
jgi:type II secretory pathway pseudopilin PulG